MTKYKFSLSQLLSFCCLLLSSICIIELISPWLAESFIPWMERHLSLSSKTFKVVVLLILLLSAYPIYKIHKFRCIRSRGYATLKYVLVFIIITLLYRLDIISHQWVFASYCNVNLLGWNIMFVDLLMLYVILMALLIAGRWTYSKQSNTQKTLPENEKSIPSLEEPISCSDEDEFAFNKDVDDLLRSIDNREIGNQALIVGLRGAWGSGKTSYLNLVKESLSKKNKVVDNYYYRLVEFSPWLSTSVELLTQDFFHSFYQAIEEKPIQITLQRYARRIVRADINWFSRLLDLFSYQSTKQMYEDFKTILSVEKTRYIVLIDDLDRLDADEILRVIQLIRNIADFPNVVFLVAYDEEYVLKQLQGRIGETREDCQFYLQKIFTIPHYLPLKKSETLLAINQKYISRILGIEEEDMRYEQIQFFLEDIGRVLSLRESVLIANKTAQSTQRVKAQSGYTVCVYDALLLNLLQLVNSGVYEGLYRSFPIKRKGEKNSVYENMNVKENDSLLKWDNVLKLHDGKTLVDETFEKNKDRKKSDDKYLKKLLKEFFLVVNEEYKEKDFFIHKPSKNKVLTFSERLEKHANEHRVDECSHILQLMFGKLKDQERENRYVQKKERIEDNYRIKNKEVFEAYFENVLPGDIISQDDFDQYLLDVTKFEEQLPKWVQTLNRSLLRRLLLSVQFRGREQGMGLLKASLSVIPDHSHYHENSGEEKYMVVLVGFGYYLESFNSRKNIDYRIFYEDLIISFLTYKKDLACKAQRFYILCDFIGWNKSEYYYFIRSYSKRKGRGDKELLKELYKPYIEDYLKNTTSYKDFNKIYLFCLENMYGEYREELASLFKEHMQRYIKSFMENYPVSYLEDEDLFQILFEDRNKKNWRTNMIEYLDSFSEKEKKEPIFKRYYNELTNINTDN